ncbi:MAG: molecular chaperone TorD family protein [Armatimonadota bacterium]|nr:molecular chaperone TorD family protein [Armatimonadota bacterium]MDR7426531.1 molecular chaperone TorD family protein [Armatimonadota bacterium]MDR7468517.1 molecular chaperone TorD family protein [Armatimonadota bacterium]MDR7474509.1 molecular chaperone TorD family protein [Armatimonadota bacterium]MDR7539832.1 molecular chaperone TorD family protein [Armatimonadota bacterium]
MTKAALRQERAGQAFAGLAIYPRWRSLLRMVRQAGGQADALQADFSRLFVAGRDGCAPNESHQLALEPAEATVLNAALEREYADEGVTLHPAAGELPDHAAVEMEFVAFLCDRERAAWRNRHGAEGRRLLLRQRQFLRQHLGRWIARFAREVRRADSRGWYGEVAGAAAAFIHHDQDLVDLLVRWTEESDGSGVGTG